MFAYIDPLCGKPAFLLVEMPKLGSRAMSSNARHLDGRTMERMAPMVCESCGRPLLGLAAMIKNVRPLPPANERHLVSRNKREGWYAGKDGWSRSQHHRTRETFMALQWRRRAISAVMNMWLDELVLSR